MVEPTRETSPLKLDLGQHGAEPDLSRRAGRFHKVNVPMRKVSDVTSPKLHMYVHVQTAAGSVICGQVAEKRVDRLGNSFYVLADGAGEFHPARGDHLSFLSSKSKAPRHAESTDAIQREIILTSRARLKRQRDAAVYTATLISAALVAMAVAAFVF